MQQPSQDLYLYNCDGNEIKDRVAYKNPKLEYNRKKLLSLAEDAAEIVGKPSYAAAALMISRELKDVSHYSPDESTVLRAMTLQAKPLMLIGITFCLQNAIQKHKNHHSIRLKHLPCEVDSVNNYIDTKSILIKLSILAETYWERDINDRSKFIGDVITKALAKRKFVFRVNESTIYRAFRHDIKLSALTILTYQLKEAILNHQADRDKLIDELTDIGLMTESTRAPWKELRSKKVKPPLTDEEKHELSTVEKENQQKRLDKIKANAIAKVARTKAKKLAREKSKTE